MNARSALFDVFGDHLRGRGGRAPVAALVRLLAPVGVAPPATRTAVSRMVRQGWLQPVRLPGGPGYALTARAVRRLDDSARRIYRTGQASWDSHWHMLVVDRPGDRAARERLRSGLGFLGYAELDDATWIGPRESDEVDALLAAEGVRAERFVAEHDGNSHGLVRRLWDLEGLSRAYCLWLADAQAIVDGHARTLGETGDSGAESDGPDEDERAFAVRSRLVHEWRKFLFRDPGLPRELLPDDWAGEKAAAYFDSQAQRLLPAANRFVDACLQPDGHR